MIDILWRYNEDYSCIIPSNSKKKQSVFFFLDKKAVKYELHHEKIFFFYAKNKGADQLQGNRAADQHH